MNANTEVTKTKKKSDELKSGALDFISNAIDYLNEVFLTLKYKKEASEVVRQAEDLVSDMNIPIYRVLLDVNKSLQNPLVADAILKLRAGKPRYVAYKNIFSSEVTRLLRVAEQASLPPNKVIVQYSKIKEEIDESYRKITGKIKSVLVTFVVFWLIGKGVIGLILKNKFEIGGTDVVQTVMPFVRLYNFFIFIPVIFYFLFTYEPIAKKANPVMRKIFYYFQTLKLLSIFQISYDIGIKTNKILDIYADLDDELNVFVKRLPMSERNAIGIGKLLRKFLTGIESVLLSKSIELGKVEEFVGRLAKKRLSSVEETTEKLVENIAKYASLVQFIPLLGVIGIFLKFLIAVTSAMGNIAG